MKGLFHQNNRAHERHHESYGNNIGLQKVLVSCTQVVELLYSFMQSQVKVH